MHSQLDHSGFEPGTDAWIEATLASDPKAVLADDLVEGEHDGLVISGADFASVEATMLADYEANYQITPRVSRDSAMLGGSGYERNARDLYSTEPEVTHALCRILRLLGWIGNTTVVWEPACGEGAMVDVIKEYVSEVIASDIVPLCDEGFEANFLNSTPKGRSFDAIITNPPYGEDIDLFMDRALKLMRRGACDTIAFVARHELDCASGRARFFRDCSEYAGKITLLWRPRWIKGSKGSPRHNYAIYLWHVPNTDGPRLYYAQKCHSR